MTLEYRVQALTDYTIFTNNSETRQGIQFKASWSTTLEDLGRELTYLEASDVVLEIAVRPHHVRKDGTLRSNVPKDLPHPGVRISFETRNHGRMSFTCDTYEARWTRQMPDWQANVRGIVLTLEALRAVGRYGATQGQEYAGFKALEAGPSAVALGGGMTRADAEALITSIVGAFDRSEGQERFRRARVMVHPDRQNGSRELWDKVERAAIVLGLER